MSVVSIGGECCNSKLLPTCSFSFEFFARFSPSQTLLFWPGFRPGHPVQFLPSLVRCAVHLLRFDQRYSGLHLLRISSYSLRTPKTPPAPTQASCKFCPRERVEDGNLYLICNLHQLVVFFSLLRGRRVVTNVGKSIHKFRGGG